MALGDGIRAGDVLRACSAMIPEMKYPATNVLLGGGGRPGFRRVLFLAGPHSAFHSQLRLVGTCRPYSSSSQRDRQRS